MDNEQQHSSPTSPRSFALARGAVLTMVGFALLSTPVLGIHHAPLAAGGAYVLILMIGTAIQRATGAATSRAPSWPRRARWMLLGGLPAIVALGATSYISTDLAPIPLFWIVPQVGMLVAWTAAYARCARTPGTLAWWRDHHKCSPTRSWPRCSGPRSHRSIPSPSSRRR